MHRPWRQPGEIQDAQVSVVCSYLPSLSSCGVQLGVVFIIPVVKELKYPIFVVSCSHGGVSEALSRNKLSQTWSPLSDALVMRRSVHHP